MSLTHDNRRDSEAYIGGQSGGLTAVEARSPVTNACAALLKPFVHDHEPCLLPTCCHALQVVLKFQNGAAVVPLRELRVTESSESVLAGTKRPPFRLVVRAIKPDGRRLNIRPAVSEEFVVRAADKGFPTEHCPVLSCHM